MRSVEVVVIIIIINNNNQRIININQTSAQSTSALRSAHERSRAGLCTVLVSKEMDAIDRKDNHVIYGKYLGRN